MSFASAILVIQEAGKVCTVLGVQVMDHPEELHTAIGVVRAKQSVCGDLPLKIILLQGQKLCHGVDRQKWNIAAIVEQLIVQEANHQVLALFIHKGRVEADHVRAMASCLTMDAPEYLTDQRKLGSGLFRRCQWHSYDWAIWGVFVH